jgi:hypothetical protein
MLYAEYGKRCVWCREPVVFRELEVDHLVPRSLTGPELAEALARYGLPSQFDVFGLENLVPSCGSCNRTKGGAPISDAPIIRVMLDDARKKALTISQKADSFNRSRKLHEAIAVIKAIHTGPTAEEQNILVQLADFLSAGWPSTDYVERSSGTSGAGIAVVGVSSRLLRPFFPWFVRWPLILSARQLPSWYRNWHDWHGPGPTTLKPSRDNLAYDGRTDEEQMLQLLKEWEVTDSREAVAVFAQTFDAGDTPVQGVTPTSVNFLAYSQELNDFLAEVTFDVDYLVDVDVGKAEAHPRHLCDLWIKLDTTKRSVVDVVVDNLNTVETCVEFPSFRTLPSNKLPALYHIGQS